MVPLKPPPTIRRLSKALAAGVVGFVAFPGTLTATAAAVVGTQSPARIAAPTIHAVALTLALAAAVAAAAYHRTQL